MNKLEEKCNFKELNCYLDSNLAIIRIADNSFQNISNLSYSEKMLEFYDHVENDPEIKGLLVVNSENSYSRKAYHDFLCEISGKQMDFEHPEKISEFDKKLMRVREITLLQRFILKAVEFSKLLIIGVQGEVVTPFIGASLASDFRIVSANARFSFSHIKYGLHPSGALPFFLPRFVGHGLATELLMTGRPLMADEALQAGIANKVVEEDKDFFQECLDYARNLCKIDLDVMRTTKKFLFNYKEELVKYLEIESKFIAS